jgi:hypothetical protein
MSVVGGKAEHIHSGRVFRTLTRAGPGARLAPYMGLICLAPELR